MWLPTPRMWRGSSPDCILCISQALSARSVLARARSLSLSSPLSLVCVSVVGLAMATTTSGFRHFILPPISAAKLSLFYKPASSQPANTY